MSNKLILVERSNNIYNNDILLINITMTDIKLIYTTFSSTDSAKPVIKQLLQEKLIACGNISSNIQSMYQWEEEIACENEVSVIFKNYL